MTFINATLTNEQKKWFGERMSENDRGRVIIPNYLYIKFKKITEQDELTNTDIKYWLIDNVYNDKNLYANIKLSQQTKSFKAN
jgi:hypothetical protein